ncbi:cupin domain-containing protein [Veillonella agrestimuris]|uniref:cupin domain-containing protein n=1 Tax=Veillonella agrestimuris TaxID=2941340 RepID=UPI00203BD7E5|nr:cupin domain-containing protein [Veillonella agrestimuris]
MKYQNKDAFEVTNVFGMGSYNSDFAQYFIGDSFLNPLTDFQKGEFPIFNVTFEPGCRNNWHIHHADKGGGQILICTAGEGWYQADDKEPQALKEGSVVVIPAGIKHWHGAKKDSWFSHIAIEIPGENISNEWLEEVSDDFYKQLSD